MKKICGKSPTQPCTQAISIVPWGYFGFWVGASRGGVGQKSVGGLGAPA